MKRQDLLLMFLQGQSVSKKQIQEFFKMVEDQYYKECFAEDMPRDELPQWRDGNYGEWSPDIKNDLDMFIDMGYIQKLSKSNVHHTFHYDVFSLTATGEDRRMSISAEMNEVPKYAVWQIRERLGRKTDHSNI